MATVGGTVSSITGGKFANGAVSGAFVHLFNYEYERLFYEKRAFGDPVQKAKASREVATLSGIAAAFLKKLDHPVAQYLSKVFAGMSTIATYNAHLLDIEAGTFHKEGLIVDTMTITTEYCKNTLVEFIYDETFTRSAPYLFDYDNEEP